MTNGNSAYSDKKRTDGQSNRNKKTNAEGIPYEDRNESWTALDKAVAAFGEFLLTWLIPERIEEELKILNPPGKRGPKYLYPPSLVLYILLLAHSRNLSYRRIVGDIIPDLFGIPLKKPTFSSLHKSEEIFFMTDFGWDVMQQATERLRARGIEEKFDPVVLFRTKECPEFTAPQKIPVCQKDVEEQMMKDREAAECRKAMSVYIFRDMINTKEPIDLIIDGSGEGISGPGIYFEHIWRGTYRRFIKQHALIDARTRCPVGFSITMERPGDSAVFPCLIRAAVEAGVNIGTVYADGAYDTTENWMLMAELGIDFEPNLKERFREKRDLPERNDKLRKEKELGKTEYHRSSGYNIRWHVEVYFSNFKKLFGERIRHRKFPRMALGMVFKYIIMNIHKWLYNQAMGRCNEVTFS